jgi:hypothetical protein
VAAVSEILVQFCEVPRIYDVYFGHGAPSVQRSLIHCGGPRLVEYAGTGQAGVFDESGHNIKDQLASLPPPPMPLVYRSYSVSGMNTVLRTFVREPEHQQLRPGAWVYVLSDHETAGQYRLLYILHFHELGKFRKVDASQPGVVPTSGQDYSRLTLEQLVVKRTIRACALLSPHALPAEVVTAMSKPSGDEHNRLLAHALARASWVNDPFTCDFVTGTKPTPPTPKQVQKYVDGKPSEVDQGERILYLVNPFVEASQRIAAYNEAVEKAVAAQMEAGRNKRYILAKRIQAVVMSDPKRVELVKPKLERDIEHFEGPIDELWERARLRGEDVLRWCGYASTPAGREWFGESYDDGKITFCAKSAKPDIYESELQPAQKVKASWLSAAMVEASHGSPEVKEMVGALRAMFYSRLDQTKAGRDFLKKQTERCLGEEASEAGKDDGLLGSLAATMKPADFVMQGWDGVLQNLLPWWYMKKGEMTFATLADFIQHKTGVNIRSPEVMEERATVTKLKQTHRAEYDARLKGAKRLIPRDKRTTEAFESRGGKVAKVGQLLARTATFWEKIGEAKKKKDTRAAAEAMSGGLNALELGLDLMPKPSRWFKDRIENLTQRPYLVRGESSVRIAKLKSLGSIASGIDLVLALQDLGRSQGTGAGIGYGLNALGAAAGLIGAIAAETGVGVAVALLGMALQAAGDWVIEHTEELNLFLRKSPWGIDKGGSIACSEEQSQQLMGTLDYIVYGYSWKVRREFDRSIGLQQFYVDVQPARGTQFLPLEAVLVADLDLVNEYNPAQREHAHADLEAKLLASAETWTVYAAGLTESEAQGTFHLSGRLTLKLDKQGNRTVQAGVSWSSAGNPDYAWRPAGSGGSL